MTEPTEDAYVPMAAFRRRAPGVDVPEPTVHLAAPARELPTGSTRASAWLAGLPVLQGLAYVLVIVLMFSRDGALLLIVVWLATVALGVVLADRDRRALGEQGIHGLPTVLLAVVPIVWLYLRSRVVWRETQRSYVLLGWHLLALIVLYALYQVAPLLVLLQDTHRQVIDYVG